MAGERLVIFSKFFKLKVILRKTIKQDDKIIETENE